MIIAIDKPTRIAMLVPITELTACVAKAVVVTGSAWTFLVLEKFLLETFLRDFLILVILIYWCLYSGNNSEVKCIGNNVS